MAIVETVSRRFSQLAGRLRMQLASGMAFVSTFVLAACQPHLDQVRLQTPGLVLSAEDGSFRLDASGPAHATPFESNCWNSARLAMSSVGELAADPERAIVAGAKRVRIQTRRSDAPLYGLLALCSVSDLFPPDSYLIAIPPEHEDLAREGKIVVVADGNDHGAQHPWVLWLSSKPFPVN